MPDMQTQTQHAAVDAQRHVADSAVWSMLTFDNSFRCRQLHPQGKRYTDHAFSMTQDAIVAEMQF